MNEHQKRAAEAMRTTGLPGLTQKFSIMSTLTNAKGKKIPYEYDFYLHLAWFENRLDYIDLTVARAQEHNVRATIEIVCKEAYALLRHGVWDTDKLIQEWMMRRFEPEGSCRQLEGIVKSPVDAAARLIQKRRVRWEV